jgi:glycine hydroxymethyltransferase
MQNIQKTDPEIKQIIDKEIKRQEQGIELIPSENFVSLAVLEALGSVLTNKYSEGYPKKRYYGGNENIDIAEQLAIDRAKEIFGAEHVNVQPLSGAPANVAVYFALLEPGDTILGMDLGHGGHLTHGHPVTHMSKVFNFVRYKTNSEGLIDFDNLRQMALDHKPKLILAGFSAYSRNLEYEKFKEIANEVGAYTMADIAHIAGLIAGKQLPNPVPIFDVVTTTTHKTLRGPRGAMIMCKQEIAKKIDKSVFPGLQGGPHENNIAAKAISFLEAMQPEFQDYCAQIIKNAKAMEIKFKEKNYTICFGQTDNHLLLIDLTSKNITGNQAQEALDKAGITTNKNSIPDDTRKPMDPSGLRLGTPAITTRGMKEPEMELIVDLIDQALTNHENEDKLLELKSQVVELTKKFPLYPELNNSN